MERGVNKKVGCDLIIVASTWWAGEVMILISMFFTLKIIYSKKNVSIKMLIEADVVVLMWNYTHAVFYLLK